MMIEEAIQLTRGCAELLEFDPMTGEPTPPHSLEYEQAQAIRVVLAEIENTMASKQELWIPVSERLPRKHQDVLLSVVIDCGDKSIDNVLYGKRVTDGWDVCDTNDAETVFDGDEMYKVVAWMPMPEPFGGVENG